MTHFAIDYSLGHCLSRMQSAAFTVHASRASCSSGSLHMIWVSWMRSTQYLQRLVLHCLKYMHMYICGYRWTKPDKTAEPLTLTVSRNASQLTWYQAWRLRISILPCLLTIRPPMAFSTLRQHVFYARQNILQSSTATLMSMSAISYHHNILSYLMNEIKYRTHSKFQDRDPNLLIDGTFFPTFMYPPDKFDPEEHDNGCTQGYLAVQVSYRFGIYWLRLHDTITGRQKYLYESKVCEKAGRLGANQERH